MHGAVDAPEDFFELVVFSLTPRGVLVFGARSAFSAASTSPFDGALQAARFLESAMPSLLHEATPFSNRPG
jgi:hypothetical protein